MLSCNQSGVCCHLFLINLNKEEYLSKKYKTIFGKEGSFSSFKEAKKYGAHFLAKREDGSCIYLKNNLCSIHKDRPLVCKGFFCSSKAAKYKQMTKEVNKAKSALKT